ncbi:16S rRNA (cytosine(967)-C(5))-methyltransferase [Phormidium yuhuli AB48]|uniref:16S rRNA (cytosine(967)-C(5))-methyltransferase n=1 Tax=Phormidium yuhuli AB48 TaxID=2940671 RepID=A0ABY5ARC4_9CYAN|nr:16S rRNA (cytosine(967)-C(5))-methyltransferase [Phormidium yuhuli]USR91565.1 16S rRNA (cytosine(967)-C(5))-methyltransferase [Phormidium yuhuli AB48]
MSHPRQVAVMALNEIERKDTYADVALQRQLAKSRLTGGDRALATELVYGVVRRRRSLDAVIDQFAKKPARQQALELRVLLRLGLYQLIYLDRVAEALAVDSTVELAKVQGLGGLTKVVNGILRQYLRQRTPENPLAIPLPENPVSCLGVRHSYPDWIVQQWSESLGIGEAEQLCCWFNQPPQLYLRVNPLKTTREEVQKSFLEAGIEVETLPNLPQGLKLPSAGQIEALPGYSEGWWTVQDASAQWVSHLLNPQPGEVIVDACAAPGGKTTHIAELMGDMGQIWACDRTASRLKKVDQNCQRLQLQSVKTMLGDSRDLTQFQESCDRVLLDVPCSGLGTLHRRADLRWRQTPEAITELAQLQQGLLTAAAGWLKPGGVLVYATCTVSYPENEGVIQPFLDRHPHWTIEPPPQDWNLPVSESGGVRLYPHRHESDGFFMVKLRRRST